jgi:hypothetical protein
MLFSLCEWGTSEVWDWGAEVSQMYRIQMDHLPLWHYPPQAAGAGYIVKNLHIDISVY